MACSPQDDLESHFHTYLKRVAHVLEVAEPVLTPAPPLPPLPAQRQLTLTQERISTGLLDALKLGQCDLLALVGEHNSPVGKSQSAAGQLLYHLQFQQGLQLCQAEHPDPELQAWLHSIEQQKAPLLPGFHWNMMIAEPEIRAALTPRSPALPFTQQPGYQETVQAFDLFAQLHNLARGEIDTQPLGTQQLNQALSGLYQNPYLGRLFYSLHSAGHYLEQSRRFLQQLEQFDCRRGGQIKAKRLRNALQHYYINGIQHYLGQIDRQFVQLAPLLQSTLEPPGSKRDIMQAYRQQLALGLNSQVYVRYRKQTLEHARMWQSFLKRCDISPT
ncbi:DUF3080 family protein [Oceanisphaera sp.]|uniref:DUF3080 family protein n=1 Tax=Oceanisphaera sp. TaxID=1929979 RepID=UPI003A8D092D